MKRLTSYMFCQVSISLSRSPHGSDTATRSTKSTTASAYIRCCAQGDWRAKKIPSSRGDARQGSGSHSRALLDVWAGGISVAIADYCRSWRQRHSRRRWSSEGRLWARRRLTMSVVVRQWLGSFSLYLVTWRTSIWYALDCFILS